MTFWSMFNPFDRDQDLVGRILVLLLWALVAVLAVLIGWVTLAAIDTVGLSPTKTVTTLVEHKEIEPARRRTSVSIIGRSTIPSSRRTSESYHLHFSIEGMKRDSTVKKDLFDDLEVGETIEVTYGYTRITHEPWPVEIKVGQ